MSGPFLSVAEYTYLTELGVAGKEGGYLKEGDVSDQVTHQRKKKCPEMGE